MTVSTLTLDRPSRRNALDTATCSALPRYAHPGVPREGRVVPVAIVDATPASSLDQRPFQDGGKIQSGGQGPERAAPLPVHSGCQERLGDGGMAIAHE